MNYASGVTRRRAADTYAGLRILLTLIRRAVLILGIGSVEKVGQIAMPARKEFS